MTFNYDNAIKIAEYYQYLIGIKTDTGIINWVCVTPASSMSEFINNLNRYGNPKEAIKHSQYEDDNVTVKLLIPNKYSSVGFYDLDNYLNENNITKCYNEDGIFKSSNDIENDISKL